MIDEQYLRELVAAVEQCRSVLRYDRREQVLYAERLDELPEWLQEALRENVGPLIGLVSRIGTRVGYRYIRTRWHVAINRFGYLESLCGIALLEEPRPIQELPPYQGEHDGLCLRCCRATITRELARLPLSSRPQEHRR